MADKKQKLLELAERWKCKNGEGLVIQLDPEKGNPMFGSCMAVVTQIKEWGVLCYVQALGSNGEKGGQAYYRAAWDQFTLVGAATWVTK